MPDQTKTSNDPKLLGKRIGADIEAQRRLIWIAWEAFCRRDGAALREIRRLRSECPHANGVHWNGLGSKAGSNQDCNDCGKTVGWHMKRTLSVKDDG